MRASLRFGFLGRGATAAVVILGWNLCSTPANAVPAPVPAGAHPRLFMSAAQISQYKTNSAKSDSSAASIVSSCQDAIDNSSNYTARGGADGDNWPGTAVRCAFAYQATGDAKYLAPAILYWRAALGDDQTIADKAGCEPGVATDWSGWDGNPPAPPVIITVTHDTGYPMRWYAPDIALTYDWLNAAPGVDAALLTQTRTCLSAWVDYYTARGYHHDEAGANYNAGYVIGKTLAAIAIGNDGGADGHLWSETQSEVFTKLLIGDGLSGASGSVGSKAGAMVGGDWAEGWQYGPLSVLEYAVAARAAEDNGVLLPEMDAWTDRLAVRYVHGTVPTQDGQWVGGDFDDTAVYQSPAQNELDAVLAGPSSDRAAAWAAFLKQKQSLDGGPYIYNAIAELRAVTPADYTTQTPAPPLWYLARGTRAMYVRTAWDDKAFWGVFSSAPAVVSDHEHFSASNFVFSRGADHLVIDASNYGEYDTLATNAVTADSTAAQGDYAGTQTPWSEAELVWARGTADAAYAARSDFAKAFNYSSTPSDIKYAHREWSMLPEGEIVTIDRVHTADAAHQMYVKFHTNTGAGNLALAGSVASGVVGNSKVAIHTVLLSGGTPKITQPEVGDCSLSCSYPCGQCDAARFAVDEYSVAVPGPFAVAVHVIDGLAKSDAPATATSLNDDSIDPAPKQNAGVLGAAVQRGGATSYVVASSAQDGKSPATMTYGVPGDSPARHVVFDAPEDANGKSKVAAVAQSGRCVLSIVAGDGLIGRPLMFGVDTAASGCTVTENVAESSSVDAGAHGGTGAGGAKGGGGGTTSGGGASGSGNGGPDGGAATPAAKAGDKGGCGCRFGAGTPGTSAALYGALVALFALGRRRDRAARR